MLLPNIDIDSNLINGTFKTSLVSTILSITLKIIQPVDVNSQTIMLFGLKSH